MQAYPILEEDLLGQRDMCLANNDLQIALLEGFPIFTSSNITWETASDFNLPERFRTSFSAVSDWTSAQTQDFCF